MTAANRRCPKMPERCGICIDNVCCGRTMPLRRMKIRSQDAERRSNRTNSKRSHFADGFCEGASENLRHASSGSKQKLLLRFGVCLHSKRYGQCAFGRNTWRSPIPARTEYFIRYPATCKGERMASRCGKILTVIFVVLVCTLAFLFRSGPVIAQSPTAVSSKAIVVRGAAGFRSRSGGTLAEPSETPHARKPPDGHCASRRRRRRNADL